MKGKRKIIKEELSYHTGMSVSMTKAIKVRLNKVTGSYKDRYRRLKSDIMETGLSFCLDLIEKWGPEWFYQNKEHLSRAIIAHFEKMSKT